LIFEQTLGTPSPFVTIPTQSVLVHLQLDQQVFHCPKVGLDCLETGKQRELQPILRFRRAPAQTALLTEMTLSAETKRARKLALSYDSSAGSACREAYAAEYERIPMMMRKGYLVAKVQL
jgi:hypothetical protein